MPFFGNPRTAKLITVGLNPAISEFEEWRCWPQQMTSEDLLLRLTGYFASTRPRPHRWFAPIQEGLSLIGKSYGHSAAHVDVSPWPTYSTKHLAKAGLATQYHSMIENELQSGHLINLLKLAPKLQHVVILQNGWMPENLDGMLRGKLDAGLTVHVASCDWTRWFWKNRDLCQTPKIN